MIALKSMSAQQKTKLEQQAVLGLAGVFVLVFLMGPAKMLFGGGSRPAVKPGPAAPAANSLPQLIQQRNELLDDQITNTAPEPLKKHVQLAVGYTAGDLRDPMKSLLPVVEKENQQQAAQKIQQSAKPAAPPKPPPKLDIQGLLWGGVAPKAIIGGQLYGVGETVQGVKILRIDRAGVTVEHESGTISYEVSKMAPPYGRQQHMGR